MMKKKKQFGAKGHKSTGAGKSSASHGPKPPASPHDHHVKVGSGGVGEHDYNIIWDNPGNNDETITFGSAAGCPLDAHHCPSFVVPANGSLTTPVRHDAKGCYSYKTAPPVLRKTKGGDPTVIIQ
jgi:hypothetical protein